MTTNFYLETRKKSTDGAFPLTLRISHKGRQSYNYLGVRLTPEEWDSNRQRLTRKHVSHRALNLWLNDIESNCIRALNERIIPNLYRLTFEQAVEIILRRALHRNAQEQNFLQYYREFVRTKTKNTGDVYGQTERKILKFSKYAEELTFDEITPRWLKDFEAWLTKTMPSANSRGIHFRNIRAAMYAAIEDELTENNPFRKFKIKTAPTSSRAMSVQRLRRLMFWPVEPYAERYRDFFILSFFLCGMNPVDMAGLKEVADGRIVTKRQKTGQPVSIRLEPEAAAIIIRYRGKRALLNVADTHGTYKNFLHQCTKALKNIGFMKREGRGGKKVRVCVFPELSCYWARHSWATIAAELGANNDVIGLALGHSTRKSVTDIYIRRNPAMVDPVNRAVIDWVCYGKREGEPDVTPGSPQFYGYLTDAERLEAGLPGPEWFADHSSSTTG